MPSGTIYNSKSGHKFIIGALSKKIGIQVLSKECSIYKAARRLTKSVETHEFTANYNDSYKSMEVQECFQMTIEAWESETYAIGTIVSNDDTTMKTQLKHSLKPLIESEEKNKDQWPKTKRSARRKTPEGSQYI